MLEHLGCATQCLSLYSRREAAAVDTDGENVFRELLGELGFAGSRTP